MAALTAGVVWAPLPATADTRRNGDVLSFALPAATLGYELLHGDAQGAWQFAGSFGTSLAATEVLKRTTRVERPDRSDRQSFPSGHATRAFAAATFVHRRHGLDGAWPLYAAALYVGYSRVRADRHRWADVAGSAAVSAASSWWLVTPSQGRGVAVVPAIEHGRPSVLVVAAF